jgi:hypothetical protein
VDLLEELGPNYGNEKDVLRLSRAPIQGKHSYAIPLAFKGNPGAPVITGPGKGDTSAIPSAQRNGVRQLLKAAAS